MRHARVLWRSRIFGAASAAFAQFVERDPRQVGLLVTLWVGTALLYPVAAPRHRVVRRHHRAAPARLSRRCARPVARDASRTHDDVPTLLLDGLRPARAGAERAARHVARVRTAARRTSRSAALVVTRRAMAARVAVVPTSEAPRYAIAIRAADRRPPAPVRRSRDARGDRRDRRAAHRRDPHHERALRARDPRAGDRQARHRSGAARAARADQSALPVQRAHHHRPPDPDRAAARAADAAAAHVAAARRAPIGRRIHDARPRARGHRGVPRHRARAVRAAAARHDRRAGALASHSPAAARAPAARRERRETRHRASSASAATSRSTARVDAPPETRAARAHRRRTRAPARRAEALRRGRERVSACATSSAGSRVSTATRRRSRFARRAGEGTIVEIRLPVGRNAPRDRPRRRVPPYERPAARRRRRRRTAGALVPGRAAAIVRRRGRWSAKRRPAGKPSR